MVSEPYAGEFCYWEMQLFLLFFFKSSPEGMFTDFGETGRGRERERDEREGETSIGGLPYTPDQGSDSQRRRVP